jgi:organic radical activating enzyme
MFGKNKISKPTKGDGNNLFIQEIFATFQGEGPFVGHPAVFVRLGGCNLACDFCDTEFDSFQEKTLEKILLQIDDLSKNNLEKIVRKLVVISGGEPFLQPIEKLCDELIKKKFLVQIETNGTIFRKISKKVKIICSPKNIKSKYHKIREDLLPNIFAIKFLISASNKSYSDIADIGQNEFNIPIYLQPMDEYDERKNQQNIKLALEIASRNGYRISLQTHKILKIR